MIRKTICIFLIAAGLGKLSTGQVAALPNFGLKSHETLDIERIEMGKGETVFHMTIENRIEGGSFCADRNIFVVYPGGTREKLISAEGIPVCPATWNFRKAGEKLSFRLKFPPLAEGTQWIDLVEECGDNCFSFFGIVLDTAINSRLDSIFDAAESVSPEKYADLLESFLTDTDHLNLGTEGLIYSTLIENARNSGDRSKAADWYRKLIRSGVPHAERYIRHLNLNGIIY